MSATTSIELERVIHARDRSDPVPGTSLPSTPAYPEHVGDDLFDRQSFHSGDPSLRSRLSHNGFPDDDPADTDARVARDQSPEGGIAALPPVDKGRQAWQFLVAATMIETTVWGLPYTVGVFHQYWVKNMFPHDESTLTLAATLQTGLMFMSTAFLGPLFTTFPRQRQYFQLVGLIVSTVGLIAAAFVTSAGQLVPIMGILYPFAGALYLPCATLIFEWFHARRGLATGIMFAGTGVGGTIFPFLVEGLLSRFGYKATMIALGIGFGVLNAVSLMFIKRRVPIPKRGTTRGSSYATGIDWKIVWTWKMWCGLTILLLTSLGNFNPTLWIPTFAENINSHPNGTALVAIMNAASVPGNALWGWLSDRTPVRTAVTVSCVFGTISIFVLWGFGTSSAMLIVFSVVWGLSALSFVGLWSRIISSICEDDLRMHVLVFSAFAVLRGVGNLTSGPISTELLKTGVFRGAAGVYGTSNFGAVLIYTGVTMFAGGVVSVFFPNK